MSEESKVQVDARSRASRGDLPPSLRDNTPSEFDAIVAGNVAEGGMTDDDRQLFDVFGLTKGETAVTEAQKEEVKTPTKRKVTYENFLGDAVEEEIDVDADLPQLAAARRRVQDLEEEMKALRDEVEGKSKAAQAKAEKAQKLLELEGKPAQDIIDALLAKDGGFDALRKKIIEEHAEYMKMTPEEQRVFDAKRSEAESIRRLHEMEKRLADKQKQIKDEETELSRKSKVETLRATFGQYKLANPDNDKAIEAINKMIFEEAKSSLVALEKSGVTVTESLLNREFKKASQMFRSKVNVGKDASKVDPKKEVQDQLDSNASKAQVITPDKQVSSTAYTSTDKEVMQGWLKDLQDGKSAKVLKEASTSSTKMSLYDKFISMVKSNPQLLRKKK